VDHVPGGQPVARRRLRLAGPAAAEPSALLEELRPCCTVDRAVDAAAAEQRAVRCVHDRVDGLLRDVSARRLDHDVIIETRDVLRRRVFGLEQLADLVGEGLRIDRLPDHLRSS
jgi:hypothetical protein